MKKKITMISAFIILAIIMNIVLPISKFAFASTTRLKVTFQSGYTSEQGRVEYSIDDGANWTSVTQNIDINDISMAGDNLRIRIVPNEGYSVDYTGITYREDSGEPLSLNAQENSLIAGGLTGPNGYSVSGNVGSVELETVEFRAQDQQFDPGNPR